MQFYPKDATFKAKPIVEWAYNHREIVSRKVHEQKGTNGYFMYSVQETLTFQ